MAAAAAAAAPGRERAGGARENVRRFRGFARRRRATAQDLARFALADAPASCSDRDASGSDGDDRPPRPRATGIVRVAPSTVAPRALERPLTSTPPRVILLDDPGSCADAMRELIARGDVRGGLRGRRAVAHRRRLRFARCLLPPCVCVYLVDVACMGAAAFDEYRLGL